MSPNTPFLLNTQFTINLRFYTLSRLPKPKKLVMIGSINESAAIVLGLRVKSPNTVPENPANTW